MSKNTHVALRAGDAAVGARLHIAAATDVKHRIGAAQRDPVAAAQKNTQKKHKKKHKKKQLSLFRVVFL
jgi:hypothetical protein